MTGLLPEGYMCPCGAANTFGSWVYAHWHVVIIGTCEECDKKNTIWEGELVADGFYPPDEDPPNLLEDDDGVYSSEE